MSIDRKRPRSWVNVAELRKRIENVAEMMCREEGLEDVRIRVEVQEATPGKKRVVRIDVEERPQIDGTDPMWEPIRGRKWEGN